MIKRKVKMRKFISMSFNFFLKKVTLNLIEQKPVK